MSTRPGIQQFVPASYVEGCADFTKLQEYLPAWHLHVLVSKLGTIVQLGTKVHVKQASGALCSALSRYLPSKNGGGERRLISPVGTQIALIPPSPHL